MVLSCNYGDTHTDGGIGDRNGLTDTNVSSWPIATNDASTVNRRFRGIADMDRFSSLNDL
jgi:hypothetical protein